MRTAVYARKSTESEDRQVQSLDDQISALRELARREGIEIDEIFVESRSAKTPYQRPEFQRLIGEIEAGRINGVLTWSINRLSRNPIDGGIISYHLQTGALSFIRTIDRQYRPEDNALLLSIENGMATSYIQDLSRNVKRGLKGKAERGWHPGRAPMGYINNKETRQIEPDPRQFPILRKGWELMLSGGYTLSEVHREMVALGLTGVQKGSRKSPVAKSMLHKIFANPFYRGDFTFGGEIIPGKHEPMVSRQEFEQVQQIRKRTLVRKRNTHQLLYSGVLRCGKCGCQIVGETKQKTYKESGRTVSYTYYHCTGARGCTKHGLSEEDISDQIATCVNRLKLPTDFIGWANQALQECLEQDSVYVAQSAANIRSQLDSEAKRLDRLVELRVDGEITPEDFKSLKARSEGVITNLNMQLNSALTETEQILAYIEEKFRLLQKLQGYESLDQGLKRGLILGLGPQHYLTLKTLNICLDPVFEKIAAFEPLRDGSQSPKVGDFVPLNSGWWVLLNDIRAAARSELKNSSKNP